MIHTVQSTKNTPSIHCTYTIYTLYMHLTYTIQVLYKYRTVWCTLGHMKYFLKGFSFFQKCCCTYHFLVNSFLRCSVTAVCATYLNSCTIVLFSVQYGTALLRNNIFLKIFFYRAPPRLSKKEKKDSNQSI